MRGIENFTLHVARFYLRLPLQFLSKTIKMRKIVDEDHNLEKRKLRRNRFSNYLSNLVICFSWTFLLISTLITQFFPSWNSTKQLTISSKPLLLISQKFHIFYSRSIFLHIAETSRHNSSIFFLNKLNLSATATMDIFLILGRKITHFDGLIPPPRFQPNTKKKKICLSSETSRNHVKLHQQK